MRPGCGCSSNVPKPFNVIIRLESTQINEFDVNYCIPTCTFPHGQGQVQNATLLGRLKQRYDSPAAEPP